MDRLTDAELYIRQAYDTFKNAEIHTEDDAWLFLELGLLLTGIEKIKEKRAMQYGKFILKSKLEIN
jgi:hypothetical protein